VVAHAGKRWLARSVLTASGLSGGLIFGPIFRLIVGLIVGLIGAVLKLQPVEKAGFRLMYHPEECSSTRRADRRVIVRLIGGFICGAFALKHFVLRLFL
jgi:hypothetical protein